MSNCENDQADNRLARVRERAKELAAESPDEDCCDFGPPCFVDCPCWHQAEKETP